MIEELKFFVEVAEVGASAVENQDKIKRAFKRIFNRLKYGHIQVAIFGPPGAGKSTLGRFLSGNMGELTSPSGYIASADIEPYLLSGEIVCTITALPGQERLRDETWTRFYRHLSSGKSTGVINVVSYGHHALDMSYKRHNLFTVDMSKKEFLQAYVEDRKKEEVRILKDLASRLRDAPGTIWMITLVTKQDLWWAQRDAVEDHYCKGEYNSIIEEIRKARGTNNFKHRYLSASLLWNTMRDGDGDPLVPTAEGYEQNIRSANLLRIPRYIDSLIRGRG